ncbi:unnamed protein product, partial [Timema podura]|nr:unnamed protein product [Timema podura]
MTSDGKQLQKVVAFWPFPPFIPPPTPPKKEHYLLTGTKKVGFRGNVPEFAGRESGNPFSVHQTGIRTTISLSSAVPVYCENDGLANDQSGDADKRSALDQVMRDYLLTLLVDSNADVPKWETFVTFCIQACRDDMCTPTMPVVLLGDMFDALTLDKCEQLFAFVENGVHTWKEELFFSACKNNLLRMCN